MTCPAPNSVISALDQVDMFAKKPRTLIALSFSAIPGLCVLDMHRYLRPSRSAMVHASVDHVGSRLTATVQFMWDRRILSVGVVLQLNGISWAVLPCDH